MKGNLVMQSFLNIHTCNLFTWQRYSPVIVFIFCLIEMFSACGTNCRVILQLLLIFNSTLCHQVEDACSDTGHYVWMTSFSLFKWHLINSKVAPIHQESSFHPESSLTAHNWQKWKRVFLTCPYHKIYRIQAVGLIPIILEKIWFFANMWNLGQFREKMIFCQ